MTDEAQPYAAADGQAERYPESYFSTRHGNDPRRNRQFDLDGAFIRRFVKPDASVCDIGCSTGEFLTHIKWQGDRYGVEISEFARKLAEENGFRFDRDVFTETDFFDLVIFRGTIQHVDEPFRFIKASFKALKPGGHVVFLATPNMNSPFYRVTGTLPFLAPELNFYVPDDKNLANALTNYGFEVLETDYPYLHSPYRNLIADHVGFIRNCFSRKMHPHAFWKSSMNMIARKPLGASA